LRHQFFRFALHDKLFKKMKTNKLKKISLFVVVSLLGFLLVMGAIFGLGSFGNLFANAETSNEVQPQTQTIYFYNNLELSAPRVLVQGQNVAGVALTRVSPTSRWFFADVSGDFENGVFVVFFGNNVDGNRVEINGLVDDSGRNYFSIAGRFSDMVSAEVGSSIANQNEGLGTLNIVFIILAAVFMALGLVAGTLALMTFLKNRKSQ